MMKQALQLILISAFASATSTAPLAQEHGVGMLTWSPPAHGMLVGAYTDAGTFPKGTRAGNRGAFYANRVTAEGVRVGREFVALVLPACDTANQDVGANLHGATSHRPWHSVTLHIMII